MIRLKDKLREGLWSGLISLLYGTGLALTLLHVTGLLAHALSAVLLLTMVTAVMTAASAHKRAMLAVSLTAAAAALIWLALGGFADTAEVLRALILYTTGIRTVLPLVAKEAVALASLLCGAAAFLITRRSAGPYPALVMLLMTVVLLWLGNKVQTLWCLVPAVIATVTLMMLGHNQVRLWKAMALSAVTVLLSFTVLGTGGVEIPALKNAADDLRQRIYDMFFFTGPRDVFSLADLGYYPQGEGQLGGPAEPTKDTIMAVVTPQKVYLRGAIMNVYTGRSWEDNTQSKRYLWDGARFRNIRSDAFDMQLPQNADPAFGDLLQNRSVTVRMLSSSASTLFVPQRIRDLKTEDGVVPYFNVGSEIFATRDLTRGDEWTAKAPLLIAGEPGIRQLVEACDVAADPRWEEVNRTYRALPEHLEQEVYDVAWGAVTGAETPYEKAMALQSYLQSNYTYTLDAPEQPSELDFVSTFLLLDKEGYCVHFASAMTVMCRMVGLPARYVEGFTAVPDDSGLALLTGEDGHAWTEVYFKGYGWLTFDATPGSERIIYTEEEPGDASADEADVPPEPTDAPPSEPDSTPLPTATPTPEPNATPAPEPPESSLPTPTPAPDAPAPTDEAHTAAPQSQSRRTFSWWLLAVILIPALLIARILWTIPSLQSARKKTERARWLVWVQASHDALRRLSLQRQPDESPMAFLARAGADGRIPEKPLTRLAGEESLMFYGHGEPTPKNTSRVRRTYEAIRSRLNPWQKLCLTLERAALLRRNRDITVR